MGCKGIPFQAGFLEQLGQGTAFCCHETVRIFALEFSGHGLAAQAGGPEAGPFFFCKGDDGQRPVGTESLLVPGGCDGQRDSDAQGPVIFSPMGDGIQMGSGIHRRKIRFSRYGHEQVAPAIPPALEADGLTIMAQILLGF